MANSKQNRPNKEDSTSARIGYLIDSVQELIELLQAASDQRSLLLLHYYWEGCPACGSGTPLTRALDRLTTQYAFQRGDIAWRHSFFDPTAHQSSYDYRAPVTAPYKVCWEMLYTKGQRYNGKIPIEAYAVPPWDRVHFPQMFFIDGNAIDSASLAKLRSWNNEPTNGGPPQPPGLLNENWELVLFEEISGIKSWEKQQTLHGVLGDGLLLHLVNQNLFAKNDEELQEGALNETVRIVIEQQKSQPQQPLTCVRYQRSTVTPPKP